MDHMLNDKLKAAKILGLDVVEGFNIIEGITHSVVCIKKDDITVCAFSRQIDKQQTLNFLYQRKSDLETALADIDNKIIEINELE